uniref:Lipocalin n=1 Tax=Rhipicephalus appendiculatus TaxID=34631 RepID=A0A131YS11_RHIAP
MVQKLAFKVLLYVGCFTVLKGNCLSCGRRAYSIKKFFSTTEPIWTYTTSGRTNIRCLVDQVNVMEKSSVIFTRSCYNRQYKVSRLFYGTFDHFRKKHMDVKPEGRGINFQEDLLYISDDNSCAVILVTTKICAKRLTYDLRIRNSHIKHRPHPKCVHEYEKYERYGKVLYDPSCQNILARKGMARLYEPENSRCQNRTN